jgi:hypothetical protein
MKNFWENKLNKKRKEEKKKKKSSWWNKIKNNCMYKKNKV